MAGNLKKLEKISKALGDVNRLRILNHIALNGGVGHCSVIQGCVDLAQPSVSHHIKILIEAELIEAEKEGRHYKYFLNQDNLNEYLNAIAAQVLPGNSGFQNTIKDAPAPELPSPVVVGPAEDALKGNASSEKIETPLLPDNQKPGKITHG